MTVDLMANRKRLNEIVWAVLYTPKCIYRNLGADVTSCVNGVTGIDFFVRKHIYKHNFAELLIGHNYICASEKWCIFFGHEYMIRYNPILVNQTSDFFALSIMYKCASLII